MAKLADALDLGCVRRESAAHAEMPGSAMLLGIFFSSDARERLGFDWPKWGGFGARRAKCWAKWNRALDGKFYAVTDAPFADSAARRVRG